MQVSLHKAVKQGNLALVKVVVEKGGEINPTNIYGQTPLALAIQLGHTEIAEFLRKHGGKR